MKLGDEVVFTKQQQRMRETNIFSNGCDYAIICGIGYKNGKKIYQLNTGKWIPATEVTKRRNEQ